MQGSIDPDDTIHAAGGTHGNANRMPRCLASKKMPSHVTARTLELAEGRVLSTPATTMAADPPGSQSLSSYKSAAPPLVSIVLPVYNAAEYLAECLKGIELQTYRPLELSICNNNSSDSSADILEEWRPRLEARGIRWVCTETGPGEGQGCGLARNVAIRASKGAQLFIHITNFIDSSLSAF